MTSVTNIRLRVLPRFPAQITGTDGLTVVRDGSDLVVKPDFGQLAEITNVPDSDETLFIAWNKETGEYNTITFQATFDNSGNARGYATKLAAEVATISSSVHGIELYGRDVVGDGLGGLYIDTDNGSTDTFISGDGRTWYLAPDIRASRLLGAPDIRNFLDTAPYVDTRTAAKALDTTKETTLILTEAGREGIFNWTPGNFSTQIAADTLEGIYIKATAIASSAGAWVRVTNGYANVNWWGAVADWNGTTGTNNLAPLQAAVTTGLTVIIPAGKYGYQNTLYLETPGQTVECYGELYWMGQANTQAFPMLIMKEAASGGSWRGGKIDHRGSQWVSATSGPAFANVALESGIICMADYYLFEAEEVHNGFDNGFGFMKADLTTGAQVVGYPRQAKANGVRTYNCGVGIRTHDPIIGPHQAGSGINILTGSGCIVDQCTDDGSRTNFIGDYAGGASGIFSDCVGRNAQLSVSGTTTFDGVTQPIGGFGIYSGSREMQFTGCQIYDPAGVGVWADGFSANNQFSNCLVKGAARQGWYIQGAGHTITSPMAILCSQAGSGLYEAIKFAGTADIGGGSFGDSTNMYMTNPVTGGGLHSYGLRIVALSGRKVKGSSVGGGLNGISAQLDNQQEADFSVVDFKDNGGNGLVRSDAKHDFRRSNASYIAAPFGDSGLNGNLFLSDKATPNKRLALGYDPTNDVAVIQGMHAGTSKKTVLINPSGADVGVSQGSWNGGHMTMGAYHLWVDSSGRLRIKSSAPGSDTDGTVIGTQT